jgi:hypothetical protein
MRDANLNQLGQGAIELNAPEQTENGSKPAVEAIIEEIHRRAEVIGSVLEEILQTGHKHAN